MAGESWEEARMMIMDKLAAHTSELHTIKETQAAFRLDFSVSMTELKTKMMLASVITNVLVGGIIAYVVGVLTK